MSNQRIRIKAPPYTQCSSCPVRNFSLYKEVSDTYLDCTQKYRQHQVCLSAKTPLYIAGTSPEHFYTLYDGWMVLYQTTHTGKRQILRFSLPGDFIGFQANKAGKIMHSASALSNTTLCTYPRSRLKEMLSEQPVLATQLAIMESRDLALSQHHLMSAGRKDAHESIAFLLLELFHRSRQQMPQSFNVDDNSIDFPPTQEDIGDAIGLTNVHVNRIIRQFIRDGLIECHHKKLRIIDEEKLSQIAEFNEGMIAGNPLI